MLAFLQAYSGLPAFHASACAPRVLRVSIRLMKSDDAILITLFLGTFGSQKAQQCAKIAKKK
jgi:hypothetical protein